jgi:hypothetical protein
MGYDSWNIRISGKKLFEVLEPDEFIANRSGSDMEEDT